MAAGRTALARAASIVSAHTASQIVSTVTALTADQSAAAAIALAIVSDALKRPVASPADRTTIADFGAAARRTGCSDVLGAARAALQLCTRPGTKGRISGIQPWGYV